MRIRWLHYVTAPSIPFNDASAKAPRCQLITQIVLAISENLTKNACRSHCELTHLLLWVLGAVRYRSAFARPAMLSAAPPADCAHSFAASRVSRAGCADLITRSSGGADGHHEQLMEAGRCDRRPCGHGGTGHAPRWPQALRWSPVQAASRPARLIRLWSSETVWPKGSRWSGTWGVAMAARRLKRIGQ